MADNQCRIALSDLIAEETTARFAVKPNKADDIASAVAAEGGIVDEAAAPLGWFSRGASFLTRGKIKNLRDLPILKTVQDRMLNSDIPQVRALSQRMFREDVGVATVGENVETTRHMMESQIASEAMSTYDKMRKHWMRATGKRGEEAEREFGELVGNAIESAADHPNEFVNAAVQKFRLATKKALQIGKANGTFSKHLDEDDLYLHRMWDHEAWRGAIANHGMDAVAELVEGSIRASLRASGILDQMDPKFITRLANGFTKSVTERADGIGLHTSYGLVLDDVASLAKTLDEIGLSPTEIEEAIHNLRNLRTPEKAGIGASKGRVKLDVDYVDPKTGLRLRDLKVNDVTQIFPRYANRVARDAAFRRLLGIPATETGIMSLMDDLRRLNVPNDELHTIETGLRGEAGLVQRGLNPTGFWPRANKAGRNFAYFTFGWLFGTASLAESSIIVAKLGMGRAVQAIPELARIRRLAADGKLSNDFLDYSMHYMGLGNDSFMRPAQASLSKWDSVAEDFIKADTAIERLGLKARETTVKWSGLRGLTEWQQRAMPLLVLQEFERVLLRGGRLSRGMAKRMAQMGYDEAGLKRLFESMNKYGVDLTNHGRTIRRTHLDNWAQGDPQEHAKFMRAIAAEGKRGIIETTVGHVPPWMQSEVGKIMGQFLGFTIHSYNTHLLRGLNMMDHQAAVNFIGSATVAGIVGLGIQHARFWNDPKKLAEETKWERIALMGVARSSWGGVLATMTDSISGLVSGDGIFNGRHSGLNSKLFSVDSTPVISLAHRGIEVGQRAIRLGVGQKRLSGDDARSIVRITPFTPLPSMQKGGKEIFARITGSPYDDIED